MNKISIATRLWLGFGLVVLLLLGAVGVATQGFQGAAGSLAQVKKQSDQIILAKDAHQHIVQTTAFVGGMAAVDGTQRQLGRIQQAIQGMSGEMRNISTATAEQAYSAEEVAQRVDGVSREISQNAAATQQMTATVQEIARTAGSLAQVSEAMSIAVAQFQV